MQALQDMVIGQMYALREFPQHNQSRCAKPVIEVSGLPIGYIWACPDALAQDVKRKAKINLNTYSNMEVEPEGVEMWKDVERVTMEQRPLVPVRRYRDMRIDRWELYQKA